MSKSKAPVGVVRRGREQNECSGCGKAVGDKPKVFPVRVAAADGEEPEVWCPTCFVYTRAPLEPGRWQNITPVRCAACSHETVAFGALACGACSARSGLLIIPRPIAILN